MIVKADTPQEYEFRKRNILREWDKFSSNYTFEANGYPSDTALLVSTSPMYFEDNAQHQNVVDTLNRIIMDNNVNTKRISRLRFFNDDDDEKCSVLVRYLHNYSYPIGVIKNTIRLPFNTANAKDVLDAVYQYYTENPLLHIIDIINFHRSSDVTKMLFADSYFKSLVAKAIQDFAEMQLIIQACNI